MSVFFFVFLWIIYINVWICFKNIAKSHWFIRKIGPVHMISHQDDSMSSMKNIFYLVTTIPSLVFFIISTNFNQIKNNI